MATRRTHIVRISPDDPPSETYIDVEVLDAISFKGENGKEMILNLAASEAIPYIVDSTGGDHAKEPGKATRRSHMKRIKSGDNKLDVEVIDCMAFLDQNGEEWILDMSGTADDPGVFDTTTGDGSNAATRRVHEEKVTTPFGGSGKDGQYLTVQRSDAIAFRTISGKEMIISCPSNDDPKSSQPRADTHVWSPEGYDPANDKGPKPPKNSDPSNYVKFVKGAETKFLTGDEKIAMGPFWWIRKINTQTGYLYIHASIFVDLPDASLSATATVNGVTYPMIINASRSSPGSPPPDALPTPSDITAALLSKDVLFFGNQIYVKLKGTTTVSVTFTGSYPSIFSGIGIVGDLQGAMILDKSIAKFTKTPGVFPATWPNPSTGQPSLAQEDYTDPAAGETTFGNNSSGTVIIVADPKAKTITVSGTGTTFQVIRPTII